MKKWTKIMSVVLAGTMLMGLCACGSQPEEKPSAGLPNPIHESDEAGVIAATGLDLPAPEGASEVQYLYIDADEEPIAELRFTLDGQAYCLRARSTAETSLGFPEGEEISLDAIENLDFGKVDISGLYAEWDIMCRNDVQERDAVTLICSKDGSGHIAWLDVAPGIIYDLAVTEGADADLLLETANAVFVPLQGEAQ